MKSSKEMFMSVFMAIFIMGTGMYLVVSGAWILFASFVENKGFTIKSVNIQKLEEPK